MESSREPERIVRRGELEGLPAGLELSLLSVGFGIVRVGLAQGLLSCVQKPSPLLQSEELQENVREIEPARGLQQLLPIQCDGLSEDREGDRSWDDVVNAQII